MSNLIALKPVLSAWLEKAEETYSQTSNQSKEVQQKRTMLGPTECMYLEDCFAIQPKPSSDKLLEIAEKLGISKKSVRVN